MSPAVRPFTDTPHDKGRQTVVFAHANGYPPGSYRLMLSVLSEQFNVYTVEHRPLWVEGPAPERLSWSVYAEDLIEGLTRTFDQPVWLCGHSMGAVINVLTTRKRPDLVKGLAALDPVLLPRSLWLPAQLLGRMLGQDLPICKVALNRPHNFQSYESAFAFYRAKRPFRRLSDETLWDYVHAGHRDTADNGIQLAWSGAWEACVYRSAPSIFGVLKGIEVPMMGIAGHESDVLNARCLAKWQRAVSHLELHVLSGGHLIPLEKPVECARVIVDFIVGNP